MEQSDVVLDTTLADLYANDSHVDGRPLSLVPCYWCSDVDYTETVAKTSKYLYQGTTAPTTPAEIRDLVIQCLSLESQRFAFAAGNMETTFFDFENRVGRLDAIKTMKTLHQTQRPKLNFVAGLEDLMAKNAEAQLVVIVPHESLASHPQVVDPDVLYELLSKRCLALSGLPTPKTEIFDLDQLHGPVSGKLDLAETWIRGFPLPRVFKTQQGMSSVGTFLVRTEREREALIGHLRKDILLTTLGGVNFTNRHLFPSSLLAQKMIMELSDCFSTAFWVRKNADCQFLGACRQDFSETNAWLGATIRYSEQEALKRKLWTTVSQITQFLHEWGYYGPAGADIMIEDDGRQNLRQWIIDLNVRMTGSLTLAFLKGHFTSRRLDEACITQRFKFPMKRDRFRKMFYSEIKAGRLIIVAWFTDPQTSHSSANLILGAEDGVALQILHDNIKAASV